ncbi:MAG: hypothetical protein AB9M60_19400, partial [Leptothrix sp. (in: b-proteobacteria)]
MCRHPFAHRRAPQLALLLGACLLPLLAAAYCDEPASADQSPMSDNAAASAADNGLLQLATLAREAVGQSAEARGAQH